MSVAEPGYLWSALLDEAMGYPFIALANVEKDRQTAGTEKSPGDDHTSLRRCSFFRQEIACLVNRLIGISKIESNGADHKENDERQ